MISSQAFLLAHLVLIVVVLVVFAVAERRGLRSFTSTNRGVRYRHLTSAQVLKMIEKAARSVEDRRASGGS